MGTLIFGAGTLVGVLLGIALISLLNMAQRTDNFLDLMDRDGKFPAAGDTYWVEALRNRLSTGGGEARPRRDAGGRGLRLVH